MFEILILAGQKLTLDIGYAVSIHQADSNPQASTQADACNRFVDAMLPVCSRDTSNKFLCFSQFRLPKTLSRR